jgi:hypothetical protein
MRKVTMVRLGIAAAITTLGALGATASGCTSDDNSNPSDGGVSDGNTNLGDGNPNNNPDAPSTGDDGGKPDATPPPPDARLIVLHAAPGLGPVRLCFAVTSNGTSTVANTNALPDNPLSQPPYAIPPSYLSDGGTGFATAGTPGIYPGTIGAFPDITSLQKTAITAYLIDATLVAGQTSKGSPDGGTEVGCQGLVGTHGLGTAADGALLAADQFTTLPTIPAQTFLDGNTYLLSLTGCVADYTVSGGAAELGLTATDICGADWTNVNGNVGVGIAPIDTTTAVTAGGIGVQFAHRSSAIQGTPFPVIVDENGTPTPTGQVHTPASSGLIPGFVVAQTVDAGDDDGGDAGPTTTEGFSPIGVGTPVKTSGEPTGGQQISAMAQQPLNAGTLAFGFLTTPGSNDGGVVPLPYPFSAQPGAELPVLGDLFALPLLNVEELSQWSGSIATGTPAVFTAGSAYTFVVVGDNDLTVPQLVNAAGQPNVGDGGLYDGRGLHIVAFPNNFTAVPNQ